MAMNAIIRDFTPAAAGIWVLVALALTTLIKTWPVWKQRLTEARKQKDEADGSLRGDLLKRIGDLETALSNEQHRCEEAMREMRREFDQKYDGLMRQFITAQMAWAQAVPPSRRTPEVDAMLESLKAVGHGELG